MRRTVLVCLAVLLLPAGQAAAKELRVDDDGAQCSNATFTSIEAAVSAAAPKDNIKVCAGTYAEQVRVPAGKNSIKVEANKPWKPNIAAADKSVITYPAVLSDPKSIVEITASQDVTLKGFEISGPWTDTTDCTSTRHYGVRVDGGGDADIVGNHITQIQDANAALRGCQDGVAIQVGRQAESQTGSAKIENNVFDNYQKNGPTIDNTGSFGDIHNNTIDGGGPNNIIARNGIQVGRGATADVHNNDVFGHSYTGGGTGDVTTDNDASGMIVFEVSGVTIRENDVFANDLGIELFTATDNVLQNNKTHDNVFDGIRMFGDTSNNLLKDNKSANNGTHDCHDDSVGGGTAGTANTWKNDKGVTQQPAGICKP